MDWSWGGMFLGILIAMAAVEMLVFSIGKTLKTSHPENLGASALRLLGYSAVIGGLLL